MHHIAEAVLVHTCTLQHSMHVYEHWWKTPYSAYDDSKPYTSIAIYLYVPQHFHCIQVSACSQEKDHTSQPSQLLVIVHYIYHHIIIYYICTTKYMQPCTTMHALLTTCMHLPAMGWGHILTQARGNKLLWGASWVQVEINKQSQVAGSNSITASCVGVNESTFSTCG